MAKILLVDDEESLRTAVDVVLTSKGHSVTLAESGMAALESVKKDLPDVIVCDIEMPQLKGFDVLAEMRKNPKTSGIPFIFLTGKTDISYLTKSMELDVDDFLTKPFTADALLAAIDIQLKKGSAKTH
jgi:DNA-binding response OmpR family regulator